MSNHPKSLNFPTVDEIRALARDVRLRARSGDLAEPTPGKSPGAVQGNVVILPREWAEDFQRFCHLNQKPCPLLTVTRPGEYMLDELGADIDIRTDVPKYQVFRNGVLDDEVADIRDYWQDDFVTFVLGCSFSFEEALINSGVPLRHLKLGTDVAVFKTNVGCTPSGPFTGPLVVSMRPFSVENAIRAIQITSRYPKVHGAPVHFGDPAAIGIEDISKPDWGVSTPMNDGEVPLFWACGVTPQTAIAEAKPPISITHKASHMLITDRLNSEFAVL